MLDAAYYRRRAKQELDLAQSATVPAAARAHYLLASAYLELLAPDKAVNLRASDQGRDSIGAGAKPGAPVRLNRSLTTTLA